MTPARFRWGLLFIQVGILLLVIETGVLNHYVWIGLLSFFPLFLIAIGLEKIFAGTKLRILSYLTSVAIFIGGFAIAFMGAESILLRDYFEEMTIIESMEPEYQTVSARLKLNGNDLEIRDATDDLMDARFSELSVKPDYIKSIDSVTARLELVGTSVTRHFGGLVKVNDNDPSDWRVSFNNSAPLDLECIGKENDIHLNMATTPLKNLKLKAEDSEVYVKIGDLQPLVTIDFSGEDSDIKLRVPLDAGLLIKARDYDDYFEALGLKKDGDIYLTKGFDSTKNRIEVELHNDLPSFTIDFY